jgi:hypothetical protein
MFNEPCDFLVLNRPIFSESVLSLSCILFCASVLCGWIQIVYLLCHTHTHHCTITRSFSLSTGVSVLPCLSPKVVATFSTHAPYYFKTKRDIPTLWYRSLSCCSCPPRSLFNLPKNSKHKISAGEMWLNSMGETRVVIKFYSPRQTHTLGRYILPKTHHEQNLTFGIVILAKC